MKAKRILNTLVVVLSIVFVMNGASMALEQAPIKTTCSVSVALAGFCIESMNPQDAFFQMEGGAGTITVYYPKLTAISATSDSPDVIITGFKVLDANHLRISYKVVPTDGNCSMYAFSSGDFWNHYPEVGTITVKGSNRLYKRVVIKRYCNPPPP